ncbi:nitronate monooxygenase, partial [Rhodococcus zopfii]
MLDTWLTRELGITVPLVGAPMGGRAGGTLAGEVTRAGGLGLIGAARYNTPEWLEAEARTAREIGGGLLGFGLMTWSLADDDSLLGAVLALRPRVVSLSFGDPAPYVERVHEAGALAISQINT